MIVCQLHERVKNPKHLLKVPLLAYLIQWLLYFGLQFSVARFQSRHQNNIALFTNPLHFRYVSRGCICGLGELQHPGRQRRDRQ